MSDQGSPAGALTAPTSATARDRFGVLSRSTLLRHTLFAVVGVGLAILLTHLISDVRANDIVQIPAFACATIGLTLLVGLSGQISLGHGAFMMVGAYTFALLWPKWQTHANLTLIGAIAAAAAISAVAGAIVGVAAARLRGPYLAGATLALAVGLPSLTTYSKLSSHLRGSQGITIPTPNAPGYWDFVRWPLFIGVVCVIVVLWVTANIGRSRLGRSMRAVRDDEIAASLSGLSVARVQVIAFVISAAWAGVGGAILALVNSNVSPNAFGLSLSLSLLAAVVIGGLGSGTGAVVGSIFIVLLTNRWAQDVSSALSIHSGKVSNNLPLLIYGALLALVMLVFPGGIWGAVGAVRRRISAGRR
jgi:branched-chain amino acid transport system permease protein